MGLCKMNNNSKKTIGNFFYLPNSPCVEEKRILPMDKNGISSAAVGNIRGKQ